LALTFDFMENLSQIKNLNLHWNLINSKLFSVVWMEFHFEAENPNLFLSKVAPLIILYLY
jgi:hypothetical protein